MADESSSAPETVTVEFSVGLADGKFKASAVVPAGQTNLTQILPVIQSLENSLIQGVTAQLAEAGHAVSCKAGCGACCRQIVPLSVFEAETLTAWIRSLPESQQEQLAQRFHQALLKLAAAGIIDRLVDGDWLADTGSARQLGLDYLYARVPCPFLEDESCSIHPIRPLTCREYLVTSPPEHCFDPAVLETIPVKLPLMFSRVLNRIGAELEHGTRGWIPLVFLFAWMKADAHPGEAVAGTGPEVLYEFVKRLNQANPPMPATSPRPGD
jgi:Fe-S-cluster containining protein